MKINNRTCSCCSAQYTYCNTCDGFQNEPQWKSVWCSENCKDIFMATTDYQAKEITKADAKKILDECDLTCIDTYKTQIVKIVNDIRATKKKQTTKEVTKESNTTEQ